MNFQNDDKGCVALISIKAVRSARFSRFLHYADADAARRR